MQIFDRQRSLFGPVERRVVVGLALAAVLALGLLAAGCGGSSGQGVAQVGTTETTTTESDSDAQNGSSSADPAAYSACMRNNGVPNFPDPDANGNLEIQAGPGTGLDPGSPQWKKAEKACQKFLPSGPPDPKEDAKALQEALKFSACMRENGVSNFPDPKAGNQGGIDIDLGGTGVDPNSPQSKKAFRACEDLLPDAEIRKRSTK